MTDRSRTIALVAFSMAAIVLAWVVVPQAGPVTKALYVIAFLACTWPLLRRLRS